MNDDIINWIILDEKIKRYNDKCKELKMLKNEVHDKIIDNIDDVSQEYIIKNKNIRIYISKVNSYSTMNDKYLLETFKAYFDEDVEADKLFKFIKDKRVISEKYVIKTKNLQTS